MKHLVEAGTTTNPIEQLAVGFVNESGYGLEAIINRHLKLGWYVFKLDTAFQNEDDSVRFYGVVIFEREKPSEASHSH